MQNIEKLEQRRLLAADPLAGFIDGRLYIDGTDGDDVIDIGFQTIQRSVGPVSGIDDGPVDFELRTYLGVTINGERIKLGRGRDLIASNVDRIDVRGFTGDDTITFGGEPQEILTQGNIVARDDADVRIDFAVEAGGGDDVIRRRQTAGAGDSTLVGGNGDDRLAVFADHNVLSGGAGDDKITNGRDNDLLIGGRGNDSLAGGPGQDQILGGAGFDNVDYSRRTEDLYLHLGPIEQAVVGFPPETFPKSVEAFGSGSLENDVLQYDIEQVIGGHGNDEIVNGLYDYESLEPVPAILIGGPGDDILRSNSGMDTLYGGFGNDHLFSADIYARGEEQAFSDRLVGGPGNDYAEGDPTDVFVTVERSEILPFTT